MQTFLQLAHDTITGRLRDQNQWFELEQVLSKDWEGDRGGPLAKRFDSGMVTLLTWNAARQLGGPYDGVVGT